MQLWPLVQRHDHLFGANRALPCGTMRIPSLLVMLLLVAPAPLSAQVQITETAGFLRTTIETYPERERQPILDYLDGARSVADEAALELSTNHQDLVYDGIAATARQLGQMIDAKSFAAQMAATFGDVTSFEFRSQALEARGAEPDVHDLARATSAVFYAVRTTKRPDGGLFLVIRTVRIGTAHRLVGLNFTSYVGKVPPWLEPRRNSRE